MSPALEIGAGGQDDVGEAGFSFEPDRLVDHKGYFALPIGPHIAVGFGHGADEGSPVFVVHADVGIAGGRVFVLLELGFDG